MEGELDASSAGEARALSYRQRLEKLAGGDVVLMKWSPTMDLLAATFADNTVRRPTGPHNRGLATPKRVYLHMRIMLPSGGGARGT